MKMTIEEIRDLIIENRKNEDGYIDLIDLDFSEFAGDVHIRGMKVKGDLYQSYQEVGGYLYQSGQEVGGDFYDYGNKVKGKIYFEEPKRILKEITLQELEKMGYTLSSDAFKMEDK